MVNFTKLHASMYMDSFGVGFYRMTAPTLAMRMVTQNTQQFLESQSPLRDDLFLTYCDSYRVQRLYLDKYMPWFKYLKEHSLKNNMKIIYDVDDVLLYDDIPQYNKVKPAFAKTDGLVQQYMEMSDIITVTTDVMADYYADRLGIPKSKFKVIPNYIPNWWMGTQLPFAHGPDKFLSTYKPRIGFVGGSTHCDEDHRNGDSDDFDSVISFVERNRNRYQFVFCGAFPAKLMKYKDCFEFRRGVNILSYPGYRKSLQIDLYVAPLQHCIHNDAKSNIKQMEAWCEGVPVLTQDTAEYMKHDPEFCFSDSNELERKACALFSDMKYYNSIVAKNYGRMNAFWLENHTKEWLDVLNG